MVQSSGNPNVITTAMILAAGLGTRMRPLTNHVPKPLVPVAGKTMLSRVFTHLREAKISKIVVNTHYLPSHIAEAVPAGTLISHEDILLDTGGGVKNALPLLGEEPFFVLNGDSVWTGSETLQKMSRLWDESKMDALLLLIKRENAHGYQGKGDFFMEATGQLSRCGEAPGAPYVYGGVHILHLRLFEQSPSGSFSLNLTWNKALEKGRLFGVPHEGEWFHIDTPDALKQYEPQVATLES
jgi:MurNAc alpha-1-phosphate uridylyltransferase